MATLKTNIEYLNDEETPDAANENRPEFRQQQSQGAAAIVRQRQSRSNPALSEPEAQVLQSLLAGKQSSQIADDIGGGTLAVREHIKSMLRKIRGH
ncbi:hypothetical protein JKG68_10630 [Microvirga aerilata]|uniref:HTH luxR-type domain-containing protein n=1 Tax=Microvirga aerilata TaxID=670292 RepID=A0A936ZGR9_9HYPH|nr:LuxR C-terminal-related transcriptional regulator [Microvirga aerilata]MBL0404424.1 hypothetical protein [Microvirga aerilata]